MQMNPTRILFAAAALAALVSASGEALAIDEYNVSSGTTLSGAGVGLRGTDAVALATGLDVTPGSAAFTVEHDGVAYYFASEETMAQFAADPDRYLPQYGGYCAFGVAIGMKLDASPRFADIVDGKLYVFLNAVAFDKYLEDREGTLAQAEQNWPAMRSRAVSEVNDL